MANVKISALPVASTVGQTDVFPVVQGGTTKGSTVNNLWEATAVGNAAYTILITDVMVYTSVAFTLPRIWTLPLAANYGAGRMLRIIDAKGTLTGTNTLTIQCSGTNTFNGGGTTKVMSSAAQTMLLVSDGVGVWTIVAQAQAVAAGNSFQLTTVTVAGNTNSTQSTANDHYIDFNANAGAGAYTATISLPDAGMVQGQTCSIFITVGATNQPKVQVFDNTTAGTKLFEWQGDGTLTNINLVCVFNGTNWLLWDAHFWA
jgi:hypothetical protein